MNESSGRILNEIIPPVDVLWSPCIFWVEPQQFWYLNESRSVTVSSMEICGHKDLSNQHIKTIQVCGSAVLHNITEKDIVTINVDIYYEDRSYLWDQALYFKSPVVRGVTTSSVTHNCLLISGTKKIDHLLVALGSINLPYYSYVTFSDITIEYIQDSMGDVNVDLLENICLKDVNCRVSPIASTTPKSPARHVYQPMFFMSSLSPV